MSVLRDDPQVDLNAPTKYVKKMNNVTFEKKGSYDRFKQPFSAKSPKSIDDDDRCYSSQLNSLLHILILLCIIMVIMVVKAAEEEGLSKGMVDLKTENLFRSLVNKP